ncbi:MAG: hypothetical protein SNJ56_01970 [Termitinemataceae bacterium]
MLLSVLSLQANPFFENQNSTAVPPVSFVSSTSPLTDLQLFFREKLAAVLQTNSGEISLQGFITIFLISLLYGLIHASGPGHRKTIVFSLFLAEKTQWWEPLTAGFFSALIHTLSGVFIIGIISLIRNSVSNLASAETALAWIDGISLLILLIIALYMIGLKIFSIRKQHAHSDNTLHQVSTYGILFTASIVPCTGTIMVLLFSLYLGSLFMGITALTGIALGQGIIVSVAAYLAWFGRESLFSRLKKQEKSLYIISNLLELSSWMLMAILCGTLVQPFISWLLSRLS